MSKCKYCKSSPVDIKINLHSFCSMDCAVNYAKSAQERKKKSESSKRMSEAKKRDKAIKERLKTRGEWLRELQVIFNKYIRLRDARLPCVSCGRFHEGQWHAGHYLSVGAHPELRFEPLNVWRQCQPCNAHLSGNQINYRKELVRRIGIEKVEWLESKHEPLKLTIEEIKELKKVYQEKCKALTGRSS